MLEPLTGPQSNVGKDNRDGLELYLKSRNNTVAGRKIELTVVDSQGQPDVGLTKAKQLVESTHVNMLMGIVITPVCYAVAQYVKDAHVPLLVSNRCAAFNLTTDGKFASPYLTRMTEIGTEVGDPVADWAYKQGRRKAILMTSDYGGGIEYGDITASAWVERGGAIIQEIHPPLGTNDYGPYVAQMDLNSADTVIAFLPGTDGLRFAGTFPQYASGKKIQVLDLAGAISTGDNLAELKDKVVGYVGSYIYSEAIDSPENKAFLKAAKDAFPDRPISTDVETGYTSGQVLEAALTGVNGGIENTDAFLKSLQSLQTTIAKGPIKFDQTHDIVQTDYIYRIAKLAGGYGQEMITSYPNVSRTWDRQPDELERLPIGKMKGQWVGMTKDKLAQVKK